VGADFDRAVGMIRDRLGANAIPIQLPIGVEDAFCGVVDLLEQKAIYWGDENLGASFEVKDLPADLVPAATQAREALVEAAAELDDVLAARFLDDEPIGPDPLRKAIREATLRMKIVPVLCGAAFKNKGVQPLLDAVVDFPFSSTSAVEGCIHRRAGAAKPTTTSVRGPVLLMTTSTSAI
jgi:elongation factor G